ncbi:hypothetical protein, variant [Spizellomyces punctatus DAOM BR117]|uniref:Hyaluronan/mRNA-binding protein domain-containing protein n=1 Tax=Spizellomyces punctatus (strain DAOM BR117) TaxID=645134 RepID=A0A0L0HF87_SPIPD|nr:hypothetical protein, variant [Spizellomyces punctatus DAOM BR117]KNC99453.1 hypothetical protein, variant [Spizellomyces punctatus DAOM BR117]|eukprot:XP_016607493.1 hypothetical protein, variant [Spizellomyces punctatus DAOM BR117]
MEVLSTNLFALLGDDEGGDAPVAKAPAPAQKDAKKATPKKEAAVARSEKKPNDRPIRNEYPRRGGYQQRGGAVEGGARPPRNRDRDSGDAEPREGGRDNRERGGFRGSRGGRGRGGFRGREFDRHSGTGRVDGVKKEVAGRGSWGNPLTAEEEAKKEVQEETAEATPEKTDGEAVESRAAENEENKEPEEVLKTLDQYLAEKNKRAAELNVRKANEGADDAQWKDAVVLKKEEDEQLFAELAKPGKKKGGAKEKAQKAFVNIDQRFADEQRGFNNRGRGRGEFRGRGDRNGDRRRGKNAGVVNVEDQTAFPSLGSK